MNTQEHLTAIRAKCVELLATAKLRTQGKWEASDNVVFSNATDGYYMITCDGPKTHMKADAQNADFIASCAGPAEAGWAATIAAIDFIFRGNATTKFGFTRSEQITANQIIDAWPEELLK